MPSKTSRKSTHAKSAKKKASRKITPAVLARQGRSTLTRNSGVSRRSASKSQSDQASIVH